MKNDVEKTIRQLLEMGYSAEEILTEAEYIIEKDRLLATAIMEQIDGVDGWTYISENEKLPIRFIEQFQNKLNWKVLSLYQDLTEELIELHKNEVDWFYIFMKQDISGEFIKAHIEVIRTSIERVLQLISL